MTVLPAHPVLPPPARRPSLLAAGAGVVLLASTASVTPVAAVVLALGLLLGWRLAAAAHARVHAQLARERDEQIAALTRQVLTDPLTGLANRALVLDRLRAAARAVRSGTGFGVLYLDLDGFKAVNDRFGHAVGDDLLAAVANRLRDAVRTDDTAGRMSGDEFVVVCEGLDGPRALEAARRRVQDALGRPYAGGTVVGVSVGAALWAGEQPEDLLRLADERMYACKRAARGLSLSGTGRVTLVR